jgi:hypothetical protein
MEVSINDHNTIIGVQCKKNSNAIRQHTLRTLDLANKELITKAKRPRWALCKHSHKTSRTK